MSIFNKKKTNTRKNYDKPFFLSPQIRLNKLRNLSLSELKEENGFTLVELIVVVMMIGILSSIAIPQFMSSADKAKQKEATGIVAALVKGATAYNTEYGSLPTDAGQIEEYARFQECSINDVPLVASRGGADCKMNTPTKVPATATTFYTSSGHYFVEFDGAFTNAAGQIIFVVVANPNGDGYINNGSAVTGCFNPAESVSEIFEFSAATRTATNGRGAGRVLGDREC